MIRAARNTFLSVVVLGSLAGATGFAPALAQGIDTSTLPRIAGAKVTYSGPASTIYTTTDEAWRLLAGRAAAAAGLLMHAVRVMRGRLLHRGGNGV